MTFLKKIKVSLPRAIFLSLLTGFFVFGAYGGVTPVRAGGIGDAVIGAQLPTPPAATPAPSASAPTNTTSGVEQFTALSPIPNLTDPNSASVKNILQNSFGTFFNYLYTYLIGIAVIIAVGIIIWSGIEIATNKDNVTKTLASKGRINNAVFGLILVLSPALVYGIINPSILKFDLNFTKVDLTTSPLPANEDPTNIGYTYSGTSSSGVAVDANYLVCDPGGGGTYVCSGAMSSCATKSYGAGGMITQAGSAICYSPSTNKTDTGAQANPTSWDASIYKCSGDNASTDAVAIYCASQTEIHPHK